jgi:hypothetical protein
VRTVCTCGAVIVDEPAEGGISHGLCPACYRTMMRELLAGMDEATLRTELVYARHDNFAAMTYRVEDLTDAREWLALVEAEVERRRR